jgi:hypothetical protein
MSYSLIIRYTFLNNLGDQSLVDIMKLYSIWIHGMQKKKKQLENHHLEYQHLKTYFVTDCTRTICSTVYVVQNNTSTQTLSGKDMMFDVIII